MRLAAAWSGALLFSGCVHGAGVSIEGNAGFAYSRVTAADDTQDHELGATAGLSLAVEADWLRDANLGTGLGVQTLRTPSAPDGLTTIPWRLWYGASIDDRGWTWRPRAYVGFSLGLGEVAFAMDAYAAGGVSYHLAPGVALHVLVGPQAVYAEEDEDEGDSFRGWGGQLRVRLFHMLTRRCDPASRGDVARLRSNPC